MTKAVDMVYDIFDRWIGEAVDADGAGSQSPVTNRYVYDGAQLLMAFEGGNLKTRYLWGPVVDQILADEVVTSTSAPGTTRWMLTDNLNTVRDVVSNSGTMLDHLVYSSFGILVSQTNSSNQPFILWTGRPYESVLGLQNNWHRWYDPVLGKWISEDPTGFGGGDVNLYRLVGNHPTMARDPNGLEEEGWSLFSPSTWRWFRSKPPAKDDDHVPGSMGFSADDVHAQRMRRARLLLETAGSNAGVKDTFEFAGSYPGAALDAAEDTAINILTTCIPGPADDYVAKANWGRKAANKSSIAGGVVARLRAVLDDYWKLAKGVSVDEAKAIAQKHGFGMELGRVSRFESAHNAVVIAKADLKDGLVNKIMLAEEIQHGLDRAKQEASRAIRRGLSNEEFHTQVFERILEGRRNGLFSFLDEVDVDAIAKLVQQLKCKG